MTLTDIRKFYGSEMERLGFGFRTFTLDEAADGLLNIHVVTGAKLMPTTMCRAGMKSGRNVCRF